MTNEFSGMENGFHHMKLLEIPMLSDVCLYLCDDDVLNMRLVSMCFEQFVIEDAGMTQFWYKQLRRMAHRQLLPLYGEVVMVSGCYPDKNIATAGGEYMALKNVRIRFGECEQESHLRFKVDKLDPVNGFKSRNMYEEWKTVAWKRMKTRYWNHYDEKRVERFENEILRLQNELEILRDKKLKSMQMQKRYQQVSTKKKKNKK